MAESMSHPLRPPTIPLALMPPPPPPLPLPPTESRPTGHGPYNRKEKSLGLLCTNFVSFYDLGPTDSIVLDDAARRLGVERRRIYDIVNILESVGIVAKKGKSQYKWIGFSVIPKALQQLKDEGLKISDSQVDEQCTEVSDDDGDCAENNQTPSPIDFFKSSENSSLVQRKMGHSLGSLARDFVKLFLTTDVGVISLEDAAKVILKDKDGSTQRNNAAKVRRLYDIANVLSAVNLIQKTQHLDTRKPVFRWLGPSERPRENKFKIAACLAKTKLLRARRAFGTDINNVKRRKVIQMERKMIGDPRDRPMVSNESDLAADKQIQGSVGGFAFGPFQPVKREKKQDGDYGIVKSRTSFQDWAALAAEFRPQYHNQELSDLLAHYVEAWRSWYCQADQI